MLQENMELGLRCRLERLGEDALVHLMDPVITSNQPEDFTRVPAEK